MKKHLFSKFPLIIFILLFFCLLPLPVLYKWFSGGTIVYFWDINFPLDPVVGLNHFFYLWKSNIFPGFFDTGWSWLPYIFILAVFNYFFHSLSFIQGLLYWCLLVASLITFYFLLNYLFKLLNIKDSLFLNFTKVIGAILYAFNTYIYYYSFRIFNPQEFIIAFLPLNFLALLHLYPIEKEKIIKKPVSPFWLITFFVSLFFMTSGFSTLIFYIEYLEILSFYLLFQLVYRKFWTIRAVLERFLFLIVVFCFNLWWFFPMYLGLSGVYARAAQIGTTIYFTLNSELNNLLNAMRLIGLPPMQTPLFPWENLYIHNELFTLPLFIFPLFILLLLFQSSKITSKGIILFLFTIFSVLLFFVKEANPPFSFILQFAFNHVPFFGVFRDAYQKAGLFYMFAYFLLFSISMGVMYETLFKKKKILALATIIFSIIATVIITAPFFIFQNIPFLNSVSGNQTLTFSAKTKIPEEYFGLKNFLEPRCQTTSVMVIPRTSILSSAYWKSTGYSYVGQDMVSDLIGCNFISTQLLDNNIDAYYSVPYLTLQQNDLNSFKNFILHSDIQLIVVRHDYVTNALTDYALVDANTVMRELNNDHDFVHVYGNKLFDVYKFAPLDNETDGLAISQASVFTNVDFTSGEAVQRLFGALLSLPAHVFINSTQSNIQRDQENVIFANCIGCEYLPGSGQLDENAVPQVHQNRVIRFIKALLHRDNSNVNTIDSALNNTESAFQSWMQGGPLGYGETYISDLNSMFALYNKSFTSDFFSNDYLAIKVRNYVQNESTSLSQNLEKNRTFFDEKEIYALQLNMLAQLKQKIWETDFTSHIFRYRLDIPESENYVCQVINNNKLISLNTVTIDNTLIGSGPVLLQRGSHKVEVSYTPKNLYSQSPLTISGSKTLIKKIQLHGFTPGSYYNIAMQTASNSAKNINVFISEQNLSSQDAIKMANSQNPNFFYNSNTSVKDFANGVNDYFYSSNNYNANYYLYIIAGLKENQHQVTFAKFSITPIPTEDTIITYCKSGTPPVLSNIPLRVNKKSPTNYIITVGKNASLQNRILTFNQSYHPFWIAYTIINGKKHIYTHLTQAGYANAWDIDTVEDGKIYLQFTAQQKSEITAVVSVIMFVILVVIYWALYKRKKLP